MATRSDARRGDRGLGRVRRHGARFTGSEKWCWASPAFWPNPRWPSCAAFSCSSRSSPSSRPGWGVKARRPLATRGKKKGSNHKGTKPRRTGQTTKRLVPCLSPLCREHFGFVGGIAWDRVVFFGFWADFATAAGAKRSQCACPSRHVARGHGRRNRNIFYRNGLWSRPRAPKISYKPEMLPFVSSCLCGKTHLMSRTAASPLGFRSSVTMPPVIASGLRSRSSRSVSHALL